MKNLNTYRIQTKTKPLGVDYKLEFNDKSRLSIRYETEKGQTMFDLFYFDDHAKILDAYYEVKKKIGVA